MFKAVHRAHLGALVFPFVAAIDAPAQATTQAGAGFATGVSLTMIALVAASAGLAAAICTGLVVLVLGGRAGRDADRTDATREDVEAAHARLTAAANRAARAQEGSAEASEAALSAAQDAARTVARLAAMTNETQDRLRDWLANADQSQQKAATLASQCGKLTEILPDLLGGAVESMQARGLAGLAEAAGQMLQSTGAIEAAAAALHASQAEAAAADGARSHTALEAQEHEARLTREFYLIINGLPEIIAGALASATARHHAALDTVADRLLAGTAGLEAAAASVQECVTDLTHAAAGQAASQASAAQLAAQCERLERELPDRLGAALRAPADLDRAAAASAADQLREGAEAMRAASEALRGDLAGVAEAAAEHVRIGQGAAVLAEQSALICEEVRLRAHAAIGAIEHQAQSALEVVESRLQDSALGIEAAAASLHDGVQAVAAATQMPAERLLAAVTRAEQVGQVLPEISSQLARQAAEARQETAELRQETERNMQMLASAAAASLHAVVEAVADTTQMPAERLEAAVTRAEQFSQVLPEISGQLARQAAELRQETVRDMQMLARAAAASEQAAAVCGETLAQVAADANDALKDLASSQNTALALTARMEAALGASPLAAGPFDEVGANLQKHAAGLAAAAGQIEAAAHVAMASAAACGRVLPDIDNQLAYTLASLREASERGAQTLACAALAAEQANAVCGASLAEAASDLRTVRDDMSATLHTTGVLAARADAALGMLPLEAGQIAAAAAALREDAAGLCAAAWQIEGASAQHAQRLAASLELPVAAIDMLSAQLAATLTGGASSLAETGAALRAQVVAGGESLAKLAGQAAGEIEAAARHANHPAWLEAAASLAAQLDRVGPLLASGEQTASRLALAADTMAAPGIDPRSAHLASAIAAVGAAAARLELRAEAHDQATTRVAEAALAVAAAAAPDVAARRLPELPTLARLSTLVAETQALQSAASDLARTAVHGELASLPPEIVNQVPAILAAIETSIQGLRGTGTALAIASDAALIAA